MFFDLHGTLIDNTGVLPGLYRQALGAIMAARYGGDPAEWAAANARVVADWDSYYADLDLGAEDGLAQSFEGQIRTTRALFRLTGRPYPPPDELAALVRELPYAVTRQCDALYPDAWEALVALRALPLTLGVITNGGAGHAEGLLSGAGLRDRFTGPVVTPDVTGYFGKDEGYFRLAFGTVPAGRCVVVEDRAVHARLAVQLGARVVLVDRAGRGEVLPGGVVLADLRELPGLLETWLAEEEAA